MEDGTCWRFLFRAVRQACWMGLRAKGVRGQAPAVDSIARLGCGTSWLDTPSCCVTATSTTILHSQFSPGRCHVNMARQAPLGKGLAAFPQERRPGISLRGAFAAGPIDSAAAGPTSEHLSPLQTSRESRGCPSTFTKLEPSHLPTLRLLLFCPYPPQPHQSHRAPLPTPSASVLT